MWQTGTKHPLSGWWILPWVLFGVLTGGEIDAQVTARPDMPSNHQWNFDVAERRMKEIESIGAQLVQLAREPQPPGLTLADRSEAARYTHWLYNSSRKFQHLARGWNAFLQRIPRSKDIDPAHQARLQEMNRSFSLRYLNMVSSATDEVLAFRFADAALRERHDRVVRLIAHLQ